MVLRLEPLRYRQHRHQARPVAPGWGGPPTKTAGRPFPWDRAVTLSLHAAFLRQNSSCTVGVAGALFPSSWTTGARAFVSFTFAVLRFDRLTFLGGSWET